MARHQLGHVWVQASPLSGMIGSARETCRKKFVSVAPGAGGSLHDARDNRGPLYNAAEISRLFESLVVFESLHCITAGQLDSLLDVHDVAKKVRLCTQC